VQPRGKSGTSSSSCKGSFSDLVAAASFCFFSFRLKIFFEALSIFGLSPETFICVRLGGAMWKRFLAEKKKQGLEERVLG